MTAESDNLVLELLRSMRTDMARMAEDVRTLRVEIQAGRHHLRGLEITSDVHSDGLDDLRRRVDRIERRMELSDPGFSESASRYEPRPTKRGG